MAVGRLVGKTLASAKSGLKGSYGRSLYGDQKVDTIGSSVFRMADSAVKEHKKHVALHQFLSKSDMVIQHLLEKSAAARSLLLTKLRPNHRYPRPLSGYVADLRVDTNDPTVCRMAELAVEKYNTDQKSELDFVSVLSAERGSTPLDRHLVVQACDPNAARVPVKLKAVCSKLRQNKLSVEQVQLSLPVPFMFRKDDIHKPDMSKGYSESLLYANINSCPIIDKRLGLKRRHGLRPDDLRGFVVKVPLDNDIVLSVAKFALSEQNEKQDAHLRNPSVVGAWLELVGESRIMYHIMLEANQGKAKRKFYSAVATKSNAEGEVVDVELMDWVVADSHRATGHHNLM